MDSQSSSQPESQLVPPKCSKRQAEFLEPDDKGGNIQMENFVTPLSQRLEQENYEDLINLDCHSAWKTDSSNPKFIRTKLLFGREKYYRICVVASTQVLQVSRWRTEVLEENKKEWKQEQIFALSGNQFILLMEKLVNFEEQAFKKCENTLLCQGAPLILQLKSIMTRLTENRRKQWSKIQRNVNKWIFEKAAQELRQPPWEYSSDDSVIMKARWFIKLKDTLLQEDIYRAPMLYFLSADFYNSANKHEFYDILEAQVNAFRQSCLKHSGAASQKIELSEKILDFTHIDDFQTFVQSLPPKKGTIKHSQVAIKMSWTLYGQLLQAMKKDVFSGQVSEQKTHKNIAYEDNKIIEFNNASMTKSVGLLKEDPETELIKQMLDDNVQNFDEKLFQVIGQGEIQELASRLRGLTRQVAQMQKELVEARAVSEQLRLKAFGVSER